MLTPRQQVAYSSSELQACPWYIECSKNWVPSFEESEKEKNASFSLSTQDVSNDEEVEEVEADLGISAGKKNNKGGKQTKTEEGKKQKESKAAKKTNGSSSKGKVQIPSSDDMAGSPVVAECPPPSMVGIVTIARSGQCMSEPASVSSELFAPSQLHLKSVSRDEGHGVVSSILPLCTSIHAIFECAEKTGLRSPQFTELLSFTNEVCMILEPKQ